MKTIKELLMTIVDKELKTILLSIYGKIKPEYTLNPASVKYHHTETGGFHRHIQEVMNHVDKLIKVFPTELSRDEMLTVAFVHDFDKIGRYKVATGWRAKYQKFDYKNGLSMNDTAKTVSICNRLGLKLNDIQINAISYHHGGWAEGNPNAQDFTKSAMVLHFADMMSVIEDKEGSK